MLNKKQGEIIVSLNQKVPFMFAPIHCVQQVGYQIYDQLGLTVPTQLSQLLASQQVQRVKAIALDIFEKFSGFIKKFKSQSNEINLKPIAMISCLCLIAILVISMLRHCATRPLPPKTQSV